MNTLNSENCQRPISRIAELEHENSNLKRDLILAHQQAAELLKERDGLRRDLLRANELLAKYGVVLDEAKRALETSLAYVYSRKEELQVTLAISAILQLDVCQSVEPEPIQDSPTAIAYGLYPASARPII